MGVGPVEIIVVLFVLFVILGPKRITNIFKSLGRGAMDFVDQFDGDPDKKEAPKELPSNEPDSSGEKRKIRGR